MIDRVELRHWRAHHHSVFEFSKGTNVLVGVMGSGKTSLADAICYALFGNFPSLNSKKVSLEEVIMRKPLEAEFARVKMDFTHKERNYSVERTMFRDGKSTQAKLYENGMLKAGPKPQQVTEEVEKLLELDYELFSRAVYSEQNEIDYFLKLSPRERKAKLDQLLELDKYEGARAKAAQLQNQLRKGNEERKKFKQELMQRFDSRAFDEAEQSIAKKRLEKIELERKRKESVERLESQKKTHQSLEEKRSAFQKTMERAVHAKALSESAEREWKAIESFAEGTESETKATQRWKESVERVRSMEQSVESEKDRSRRIQSMEEKMVFFQNQLGGKKQSLSDESEKALEKRERELQSRYESLGKALQLAELRFNQSSQRVAALVQQRKSLEESAQGLSSLAAHCPVCQRQINEILKKALVEENRKKIEVVSEEIEKGKSNEKKMLEDKRAVTLQQKQSLDEIQRALSQKQVWKEFQSIEKQRVELAESMELEKRGWSEEKLESMAKELEWERKQSDRLGKAVEFFEKKSRWNQLETRRKSMEKELESISFDERALNESNERLHSMNAQTASLGQELKGIDELLNQLEQHAKTLRNAKEQLEGVEQSVQRTDQSIEKMALFVNALEKTQGQLREEMVKAINQAMQQVWPRVYPYKDYESAQLNVLEGNYEVLVRERSGKWVRVEGILSGGERSAAAITIRIAISLVLTQQLSWLILDEPTHNLDANAVTELSRMVRDHLPELVDQVFVITHEKEMEKAASARLYVLQRDKDTDGVTVPVQKALH